MESGSFEQGYTVAVSGLKKGVVELSVEAL